MKALITSLLIVLLVGCEGTAPPARPGAVDGPCSYRSTGRPPVCAVSPAQLIVDGASLEARDIVLVLYYPGFGADVMFASREASDSQDLASAFVIEWPEAPSSFLPGKQEIAPGYYRLYGRFKRMQPLMVGEGMALPVVVAGGLYDLVQVQPVKTLAEIQRNCEKLPNCTMQYEHGVLPLPKLELAPVDMKP